MVQQKLDPKWLEGLKFYYADKKMVEKNGRKTLQAIPMERPLKESDLLDLPNGEKSWKDLGDKIVMVTKNGKKYTVDKNPKPKEAVKEKIKE